ncbi:MAG TPA: hypothetical protein VFC41_02330, partial [Anaerovoracaceae bacterium]|nr:hypothetical protein [Anaerovoracaceae bacterium]
ARRRAVRTRETDVIVFRFSPYQKRDADDLDFLNSSLSATSQFYFKTKGPVTTAARKAGEFFNDRLIKYNLLKKTGSYMVGSFQLLIMRSNEVYFANAGVSSVFVLSKSRTELFKNRISGNQGVGISKGLNFKFFHAEINNGDRVVLSASPPEEWTPQSLSGSTRLSLSHLRRLLIQQTERDFEAVVIQFRTGNGSVHQLRMEPKSPNMETDIVEEGLSVNEEIEDENNWVAKEEIILDDIPLPSFLSKPEIHAGDQKIQISEDEHNQDSDKINFSGSELNDQIDFVIPQGGIQQTLFKGAEEKPLIKKTSTDNKQEGIFLSGKTWEKGGQVPSENISKPTIVDTEDVVKGLTVVRNGLLKITNISKKISESLSSWTASIFSRSNPTVTTSSNSLTTANMLFIAILVPVLVVAIATTVYFKSGRGEQQNAFILQANDLIKLAASEVDLAKQVIIYQDADLFLDEADKYGVSDPSKELRTIIQQRLDVLQGVTRVKIQPTVAGGLDRRMEISRLIVSSSEDLYALDQGTGRVLRLIATRPDYQVDTSFVCGPGKYGSVILDKLIDIDIISSNNSLNAAVLGIDANGNLLLCIPGGQSIGIKLQSPELNWGQITAVSFNEYNLFVLDVNDRTRDVYVYASIGLTFNEAPDSLFEENIPENLVEMVDMAIYQENLYILSQSGQLMKCSLGIGQTICEQNIGYG